MQTYDDLLKIMELRAKTKEVLNTLKPLNSTISKSMLKRLAEANITYDFLLFTYETGGKERTINLLKGGIDGTQKLIKAKRILDSIMNHIESLYI